MFIFDPEPVRGRPFRNHLTKTVMFAKGKE